MCFFSARSSVRRTPTPLGRFFEFPPSPNRNRRRRRRRCCCSSVQVRCCCRCCCCLSAAASSPFCSLFLRTQPGGGFLSKKSTFSRPPKRRRKSGLTLDHRNPNFVLVRTVIEFDALVCFGFSISRCEKSLKKETRPTYAEVKIAKFPPVCG